MNNKIVVITGSNSGIGKATAIDLAKKGYEIIMLVRDSKKSQDALKEIKQVSDSEKVNLKHVELSSIKSIEQAAEAIKSEYDKIDVLVNNAGVYKLKEEKSDDEFEMSVAVNYIAPYALTNYLLPLLKKSNDGRIINLTSDLYKKGNVYLDNRFSPSSFNGNKIYADSKLLVLYFTKELSKLLEDENISVNAVHPGSVGTNVFREWPKWFSKIMGIILSKPEVGAKASILLASSDGYKGVTGKYLLKSKQKETADVANDMVLSKKLRLKTEELTGIKY